MTTSDSTTAKTSDPAQADARPVHIRTENGHQIIHLPDDVRLDSDTVFLHQDVLTGDVILSPHPKRLKSWNEIFAQFDAADIPDDFLVDRPFNTPVNLHGVFDDLDE